MGRIWVLISVVAIAGVIIAVGNNYGATSGGAEPNYYFRASTAPIGVIGAIALIAFVVLYPQDKGAISAAKSANKPLKILALLADSFLVALAISPIAALPIILLEAGATGYLQWTFERTFSRPTDLLTLPFVLGIFVTIYVYFSVHSKIGRQTISQYVLGFRGWKTAPQSQGQA